MLNEEEALRLLSGSDLLGIGMAADALRREKHPGDTVTYALRPRFGERLEDAAAGALGQDRSDVILEGLAGVEGFSVAQVVDRIRSLGPRDRAIRFHDFPVRSFNITARDLTSLRAAGVRSLILVLHAGDQEAARPLQSLLSTAQSAGLSVRAALVIGEGESFEQRIAALALLRSPQQQTGAVDALEVRVHHPDSPEARREEEATAVDYLKTLGVARLLLEDIPHIQADWLVMGPKVLELALRFGANDAGSVPWSQAGELQPSHHGGEAELRRIIRDAGFVPVERDPVFRQSLLR